jgi:hypothetical protein
MFRDRPFNLKGGGYGILFSSEFLFRTTQELEYFFVCRAKREIFFQNLTLGYMTKTLNQIILFFLHQNQNIFFSNIGNQNIVLEKKPYPPPPFMLNGRSLITIYTNINLYMNIDPVFFPGIQQYISY